VRIPAALQEEWRRDAKWLARLPELVAECAERWQLALEEPVDTPHSLVVPAGDHVLKVNAPLHYEADHEASALECWAGRGAVLLVARDDERRALLLERCRPGTRLDGAAEDRIAVVAQLMPRLWADPPPLHPFRSIGDEAGRWAEAVPRAWEHAGRPFERTLLEFAVDAFQSCDPGAGVLVNQDFHGGNVLRATREPWLVIDPKPAVGEREVSAVGLLRNAAVRGGRPAVRRWLDGLADLGLHRQRLRAWGVAHALAWGCDAEGRWSDRQIEAARMVFSA
jgi:streptomycin 6-kinase